MTELDPFEMRLQSAVRRYLADAPVEVEAAAIARRVRAETSRRRILPAFRPFRSSPALAWVLLALLLFAVLLATLIVAGSQRRQLPAIVPPVMVVAECPPGSTPDEPGRVDQARPLSVHLRMALDRDSGQIVAVVPHDDGTGWETWTFDVCTNEWTRADPIGAPQPGPVEWPEPNLVYDWDSDLTIGIDRSLHVPLAYDFEASTWTAVGKWPARGGFVPRLTYDQHSGLVYVQQISSGDTAAPPQHLWTYDVETDTWDEVLQTGRVPPGTSGDHLLLAYDTAVDRIVAVQSHSNRPFTWQLDPRTGAWTASAVLTPAFNTGWVGSGGEIAYDEVGQRTVVFSDGYLAAYDAVADEWETLLTEPSGPDGMPLGPRARLGHWMVYDALNERIVVAGGQYRTKEGWVRADDVWGFDPAKEEWVQLLAPSRVERFDEATETWVEVEASARPD